MALSRALTRKRPERGLAKTWIEFAAVARDVMLGSRVSERQLTPASTAANEAGEQGVAMLGSAMVTAGGDVLLTMVSQLT